jgi:hypothetical protein
MTAVKMAPTNVRIDCMIRCILCGSGLRKKQFSAVSGRLAFAKEVPELSGASLDARASNR